jgi:hypothetical protein
MDCSICYEAITESTGKIQLSCSHSFHIRCGVTWLSGLAQKFGEETCPMCRHKSTSLEEIPKHILVTYNFAAGTREEIHTLLKRFGGRGISNILWNSLRSNTKIAHETNLVMDRSELAMLMSTNGCKKEVTDDQWYSISQNDDWVFDSE